MPVTFQTEILPASALAGLWILPAFLEQASPRHGGLPASSPCSPCLRGASPTLCKRAARYETTLAMLRPGGKCTRHTVPAPSVLAIVSVAPCSSARRLLSG